MSMTEPIIRWDDIHKSFDGKPVLQGVSLEVFPGESLAIIGRSGCGKTVLMKTLLGLTKPDRGEVYVEGRQIVGDAEALDHTRRMCGMVFQHAALFDSMTVAENMALPYLEHTDLPVDRILERVSELLSRVGMAGAEPLKPSELSGGMRKRVGLARALAEEPRIILYDEPTTGLDPVTADSINDLILQMQNEFNVTGIVVTHDLASARKVADRVAMLHEGRVVFLGAVDELFSSTDPTVRQFVEGVADEENGSFSLMTESSPITESLDE